MLITASRPGGATLAPPPREGYVSNLVPAIAHDYLLVMRGAERTFADMAAIWPQSPIYTLLHDAAGTDGEFAGRRLTTSRLQHLRPSQKSFRRMLPLFPLAVRDLAPKDVPALVTSSSAFAHGIRAPEGVPHVCYCHSPFRYVWHERETALKEVPRLARPAMRQLLGTLRQWDERASAGVTHYVANSAITQQRIGDFYGRDSTIVHPPVDVARFDWLPEVQPEDWFLTVGEVTRHKRVHITLEAARRAGRQVRVVGTGPDLDRLRREYAGSAEFLGRVGDAELDDLFARTRALVMANVEEFGIAAVEAQAAGRPVLAADAGGARETVVDGVTGYRVPVDDVDALAAAMHDADLDELDPEEIRANAQRFSRETFRDRLGRVVDAAVTGLPVRAIL
jgi:glycosyltransferase involved in cell wall biosynthesis